MVEVPHEVSPDQGHIQWVSRTRMDRAEKTFFKNKIFDGNGRRAKMRKPSLSLKLNVESRSAIKTGIKRRKVI